MNIYNIINTEEYVKYSIDNYIGTLKVSNFKGIDMGIIGDLMYYMCRLRGLDKIYIENGSLLNSKLLNGVLKGKYNIGLTYKGFVFTESNYKHKLVYNGNEYLINTTDLNKLLISDSAKDRYKKFRESMVQDLKELIYVYNTGITIEANVTNINKDTLSQLALYYDLDTLLVDTRFLLNYLKSGYIVPTMLCIYYNNIYLKHISKLNNITDHLKLLRGMSIDQSIVDNYIYTLQDKDINLRYNIDTYLMHLLDNIDTICGKECAISSIVKLKELLGVDNLNYVLNNVTGYRLYKTKSKDSRLLSKQEVQRGVLGHSKYIRLVDDSRIDLISRLGSIVLNANTGVSKVQYTLDYLLGVVRDLSNIDFSNYIEECKQDIQRYEYVYMESSDDTTDDKTTIDYVKEIKALGINYIKDKKLRDLYIEGNNDLKVLQNNLSNSDMTFYYISIGRDIVKAYNSYTKLSSKQKAIVLKYYTFLMDSVLRQCRVLNLNRDYIINKKVKGYRYCLNIVDSILKNGDYTQKQGNVVLDFYLDYISSGDKGSKECEKQRDVVAKGCTVKQQVIDFSSDLDNINNIL